MSNKYDFSISQIENPVTKRPFGERYEGQFIIRRPTKYDKRDIAIREQAYLGGIDPRLAPEVANDAFIYAHLDVLCEKEGRPDWCYPSKMYEGEDEQALLAVWQEVDRILEPFRTKRTDTEG